MNIIDMTVCGDMRLPEAGKAAYVRQQQGGVSPNDYYIKRDSTFLDGVCVNYQSDAEKSIVKGTSYII